MLFSGNLAGDMRTAVSIRLLPRAWYAASFSEFVAHSEGEVIGQLTNNSNCRVELEQRDAWRVQIELIKQWVRGRSGQVLLEFNVPRALSTCAEDDAIAGWTSSQRRAIAVTAFHARSSPIAIGFTFAST